MKIKNVDFRVDFNTKNHFEVLAYQLDTSLSKMFSIYAKKYSSEDCKNRKRVFN